MIALKYYVNLFEIFKDIVESLVWELFWLFVSLQDRTSTTSKHHKYKSVFPNHFDLCQECVTSTSQPIQYWRLNIYAKELKLKFFECCENLFFSYLEKMGLIYYVKLCANKHNDTDYTSPDSSKVKKKSLYERSRKAIYTDCMCKQNCLATLSPNFSESLLLLQTYMDEWYLLDKKDHRCKFLELLKAQTSGEKV
jgi:hypothetical protein